jgi:hypothetical protein
LFVAEGTSASKMQRILHNAYLHKALRSFEACCGNAKNAIIIFGHSLADNDMHVLRCIPAGGCSNLVIGLLRRSGYAHQSNHRDKSGRASGASHKAKGCQIPAEGDVLSRLFGTASSL